MTGRINITQELLRLLRSTKFQELLNKNDFDAIYAAADATTRLGQDISDLTWLLLESGIDPLRYMKHIPEWFLCNNDIKSFTVPDNIKSIGDYAFYSCSSLKSIYVGNNVAHIGYMAFYGCYSLVSITIPRSVTSISDMAFYSCNSLKKIIYRGTIEGWKHIKKAETFERSVVIHCSDGEIIQDARC